MSGAEREALRAAIDAARRAKVEAAEAAKAASKQADLAKRAIREHS
jgi:hypothetical protein